MANLPHQRDRFQPAEAFFNPFPLPLADRITRFFKERGYESAAELTKNEISQLPGKPAEKKFEYDAQKIFDKPDTAKLKNDKTLNDAGSFLQSNRFGVWPWSRPTRT